jgi:hypothetical protein
VQYWRYTVNRSNAWLKLGRTQDAINGYRAALPKLVKGYSKDDSFVLSTQKRLSDAEKLLQ